MLNKIKDKIKALNRKKTLEFLFVQKKELEKEKNNWLKSKIVDFLQYSEDFAKEHSFIVDTEKGKILKKHKNNNWEIFEDADYIICSTYKTYISYEQSIEKTINYLLKKQD